ncbi:MAG: ABC transporter substrate-binding protein [Microbacteriaceae bacterium]
MSTKKRRTMRGGAIAVTVTAAMVLVGCEGAPSTPVSSAAAGGEPAAVGTVAPNSLKGTTLTFVSYGGIYQDGQMKAGVTPFGAESGAKILQDGPTDNAKLKAQVMSGNVSWDVFDTTNVFTAQQCEKLFLPLDKSIVDTSKIPKGAITDKCSVPAMGYGLILVYNTKKYGANPPTGWADFYDTAKFPGKRAIEGSGDVTAGTLETALLADGVSADHMYPLDIKRALKKMSTIRDDTVFWTTGAQAQQFIESGQVDMALMWNGRAYSGVKNGAPFAPVWNQWMPEADTIAVPKGVKDPAASFALINYYLGAQQQAKLTELTSYSPVNVDSKPKMDDLLKSFLTSAPERSADVFKLDISWWAQHRDDIVSAYTSWLAG